MCQEILTLYAPYLHLRDLRTTEEMHAISDLVVKSLSLVITHSIVIYKPAQYARYHANNPMLARTTHVFVIQYRQEDVHIL